MIGVRQRAHSPDVGADTVPVTSTPSDTDSIRRSSFSGARSSIPIRSSPMRDGLGTVSEKVIIDPGRRPSREMLITSGDREARRAAAFACVAINVDLTATAAGYRAA